VTAKPARRHHLVRKLSRARPHHKVVSPSGRVGLEEEIDLERPPWLPLKTKCLVLCAVLVQGDRPCGEQVIYLAGVQWFTEQVGVQYRDSNYLDITQHLLFAAQ